MAVRFVISLIFALLVAIFAIQNSSSVTISFLFANFNISQALVIIISAVFGAIIVMVLATITQVKLNLKLKNSSKTIAKLQEENNLLAHKVEEFTKKTCAEGNDTKSSTPSESET